MEIKKIVVGPFLTNCYFLISQKELAILDPGGKAETILEEMKKEIKNKKVKYIILTHYHTDHTLGAEKLSKKTKAKILISKADKDFVDFKVDKILTEGEEIEIGKEKLKVIETPGHSPGSICLLGKNFVFTGDTIFEDGFGRTDLPGGSSKDLKKSLKKLSEILPKDIKVYPGHGEEFILGKRLQKFKK